MSLLSSNFPDSTTHIASPFLMRFALRISGPNPYTNIGASCKKFVRTVLIRTYDYSIIPIGFIILLLPNMLTVIIKQGLCDMSVISLGYKCPLKPSHMPVF